MESVSDRFATFLKYKGKGQTAFEEEAGISRGYVKKAGENMGSKIRAKIKEQCPDLNIDWLLTGKGSMLVTGGNISSHITNTTQSGNITNITGNNTTIATNAQPLQLENIVYVPLVSQYAYAGYISGYADEEYIEHLPIVPFVASNDAKGNYVAFEVRGDSMDDGTDDGYKEGDRVLGREIPQDLWANSKLHIRKWDFVIVHSEGILIKRIIKHDVEKHLITIHSLNEFYEDRIINLKDVKKIFNVIELQRPKRR